MSCQVPYFYAAVGEKKGGGGDRKIENTATRKLIFCSARVMANQLILMYYFMQDRVQGAAQRMLTAVRFARDIYYPRRL